MQELISAAQLLREGGLVAFPTETVYGLGADARKEESTSQIFIAKGRPKDNPLIVHFGEPSQISPFVQEIPEVAQRLMKRFWPGPLTLILKYRAGLSERVTAGLDTVAIRIPDHPVALALLQLASIPIAAPSANRSGKPSPTNADHVWNDLAGKIDILLDGGPAKVGVESTVVDVTGKVPTILRPGGITVEELRKEIGKVEFDPGLFNKKDKPRSPGMKYRHYSPQGELWIVRGVEKNMIRKIKQLAKQSASQGKKVGILTTVENRNQFGELLAIPCGSRKNPASVASNLYHALRQFDDEHVEVIYAESFPENGLFRSVMNRLVKAAGGRFIQA
ncbi:L-threonylcarbamoyladenylate synthase [Thermoflavimicrobium daqui]|uniref:Threonylcarbamoyl-AMP synthase n=1 Tax=Thermoflavimicrobium daqui TaxID=2137476 RepID=A0A364K3P9_9BACL|nr:L-threonylcarbamoyladenylate synthase [Thermoflavimicrobium daqui]RAL23462.1 threonylcarbamoyl-AMP synthase [Thermoflavimicrobium daqui]